MKLLKYIANLGYGTRREVAEMFAAGRVRDVDGRRLDSESPVVHDRTLIDGRPLDVPPGSLIAFNKPVDYVTSTADTNPVVYDLLPGRFRARSPVIAPVGRLDRDTSGLLLFTDDGQLNHRITSPRIELPKVYEVGLASDLRGDEVALFASGTLLLEGETSPLLPATLETIDARHARVTLAEGRYHQVRRMFAAAGNHVETLHRSAIGPLSLGDLATGAWRLVEGEELERFRAALATKPRPSSPTTP